MRQRRRFTLILVFSLSALLGVAQDPKSGDQRSSYMLGPDDQITIHSLEVEALELRKR